MLESSATGHFRLFLALSVPEAVKEEIDHARTELLRVLRGPGIRWTRRDQLHLTLRFLGKVEAGRVDGLMGTLRSTCAQFAPLSLEASGLGFFPDHRRPRVIWVGVNDRAGRLPALQQAIQAATLPYTAEKPENQFTGHLTLGRIKHLSRAEGEALARLGLAMATRNFGPWTAREVELIRSQLSEHGAAHTRLASVLLSPDSP